MNTRNRHWRIQGRPEGAMTWNT